MPRMRAVCISDITGAALLRPSVKIMRRTAPFLILLAAVVACVLVGLHFRGIAKHSPIPVQGLVSLSVIGFTTNSFENTEYYCALIRMANKDTNAVFYLGDGGPRSPGYKSLRHAKSGWQTMVEGFMCGILVREFELRPSQSIDFEALILEGDKPCQVTLRYWSEKDNRKRTHTAATKVFELSKIKS
jgi:hypothetical protein